MGRTRTVRKKAPAQVDQSPKNEIRAKAEVMRGDLENEYAKRLKQLQQDGQRLIEKVDRAYSRAILDIPREIRDMKFVDYMAQLVEEEESAVADNKTGSGVDDDRRRTSFGLPTMAPPPSQKKRGRPSKQNTSKYHKGSSSRGSKCGVAATPVGVSGASKQWPIITPKVNPRSGLTPLGSLRRPRAAEITWSVRGSPVSTGMANRKKVMTSGNNSTAKIENAVGDIVEVLEQKVEMDDKAMEYMTSLQAKLAQMLNNKK